MKTLLRAPMGVSKLRSAWIACCFSGALMGCHHAANVSAAGPVAQAPELEAHDEDRVAPKSPTIAPITRTAHAEDASLGEPVSTEIGLASWYGPAYHNHPAADGSIYDQNALTVAHRTLPLGTTVRITNVATGESVIARVTDRGPFIQGRTLDLSMAAAKAISVYRAGVAKVKIEAFPFTTSDPEGRWCVQIGAFIDPNDAVQLKNDLARRYASAKVIEFAGPTGHWVRIQTRTEDKTSALKMQESIHVPDADPYLVRLN